MKTSCFILFNLVSLYIYSQVSILDYYDDGTIKESYSKKGNGFVGDYKFYYPSGQLMLFSHSDSVCEFDPHFQPEIYPCEFSVVYHVDHKTKRLVNICNRADETAMWIIYNCNIPIKNPFTMYHQNGNILGNFSNYDQNSKYELCFDTLFNPAGDPAVSKYNLTDTLSKKRFLLTKYHAKKPYAKEFYIQDSLGNYNLYEEQYCDGHSPWVVVNSNYSFLHSRISGKDSLMLLSVQYCYGKIDSSFYYPAHPKINFKTCTDPNTKYRIHFRIVRKGPIWYYEKIGVFDNIEVHGFYHYNENEAHYDFKKLDSCSLSRMTGIDFLDAVLLKVDGRLYTGQVKIIRGRGKKPFYFKEGVFYFDMSAALGTLDMKYVTKQETVMTAEFKDGYPVHINDYQDSKIIQDCYQK